MDGRATFVPGPVEALWMEVYGYLPLYGTSAVDADVDSKHSLLRKYTKVLGISTADGIRGSPGWVSGLCVDYLT